MATQNLKFHKVAALPTSCALGDVYYVVGQGIYVCINEASSGASEAAGNYQRFSYANAASTSVVGVTKLSDSTSTTDSTVAATSTAVKAAYNKAAAAETAADSKEPANTAVRHPVNSGVGNEYQPVYVASDGNVSSCTFTLKKSVPIDAVFTDTHNSHKVTFTNNAATNSTGDSVAVVTTANSSTTASSGDIVASTTRVNVPTLAVTRGLADRISANESAITNLQTVTATGMQYKGTISSISTTDAYVAGSVYRVSAEISIPAIQSATNAIIKAEAGDFMVCSTEGTGTAAKWDVWQANVNKDAYWDNNNPVSGNFVIADGTTGKIKDSGKSASSFDAAGTASSLVTTLRGGSNGTLKGAYDAAAAAQSTADSKWAKVVASTTAQGIMQVGTGLSVNSGTVSVAYGTVANTACQGNDSRLSDTRTPKAHNQASNTITAMTGYSKPSSASAIAVGDSLNAAIGKLEYKVDTAQATANGKWTAVDATTTSKGIASFNASNFAVSSGAVSLVWATFA